MSVLKEFINDLAEKFKSGNNTPIEYVRVTYGYYNQLYDALCAECSIGGATSDTLLESWFTKMGTYYRINMDGFGSMCLFINLSIEE